MKRDEFCQALQAQQQTLEARQEALEAQQRATRLAERLRALGLAPEEIEQL
jgi:hypothetical protein